MPAEIPSRQVAQPGGGCEVTCYVTDRQLGRRRAATALSESSGKGRSLIIPAEDGVGRKASYRLYRKSAAVRV